MSEKEFILIDPFVLASFPQVLDLSPTHFNLITTTHVLMDIQSGYNVQLKKKTKKKVLEKIEESKLNGKLEIRKIDLENDFSIKNDYGVDRISSSEQTLLDLSFQLRKSNSIRLATMSDQLVKAARDFQIQTLNLNQLIEIYARQKGKTVNELKLQIYYERKDLFSLGGKLMIGILIAALFLSAFYFREEIIRKINVGGTITLSIMIAILLYLLRERQRIIYGIIEFGAGLSSIILIFYPSFDLKELTFDLSFSIKFLGGLYIMVRGIDNMVKGLSTTRTGEILRHKYRIGVN